MKKINKTICLDNDVLEFLNTQENASNYINVLIMSEMRKDIEAKKSRQEILNTDEILVNTQELEDAKLKKEADKKRRSTAWESLDLEVREEIKDIESWGVKWHDIFYPMFLQKGSLSLKDVRDWYFANRDGYKQ